MITEGSVDFRGYKIWYRLAESATPDSNTPLLLLHGGPGLGSDYLEPLEALADKGRTVIRFDQLGCGRSHRPRDLSLWTISSCVEQTEAVRKALRLDRIHLLGHSWGGMVALEYLLAPTLGVQSACLCSPVVSVQLWVDEAHRLLSEMPSYISEALHPYEKSYRRPKRPDLGAKPARSLTQWEIDLRAWILSLFFPLSSLPRVARIAAWILSLRSHVPLLRHFAYVILSIQFFRKHGCRLQSMPFGILKTVAGMNKEIYETLMGPSEFFCPGLLKDWDIRPRLSQIRCPTLILSGLHDEATPAQMAILKEGIADSEKFILKQSAHFGMWEEPDRYRRAILEFINGVDARLTLRPGGGSGNPSRSSPGRNLV
jgi:pimeloyl-ACP methyl ester carboxylesterase